MHLSCYHISAYDFVMNSCRHAPQSNSGLDLTRARSFCSFVGSKSQVNFESDSGKFALHPIKNYNFSLRVYSLFLSYLTLPVVPVGRVECSSDPLKLKSYLETRKKLITSVYKARPSSKHPLERGRERKTTIFEEKARPIPKLLLPV